MGERRPHDGLAIALAATGDGRSRFRESRGVARRARGLAPSPACRSGRSLGRSNLRRAPRDVGCSKARLKAQLPIERMNLRISPTALHQHMMAVACPGMGECCGHDGLAVALAAQLGMADHVFEKAVTSPAAQEVRRGNQHASRGNAIAMVGNEDMDARLRQRFLPDLRGTLRRLCRSTHLRDGE